MSYYNLLDSHGIRGIARGMPGRRNPVPRLDGFPVPAFADKNAWAGVFHNPLDVFSNCRSKHRRGTNEFGAFLDFKELNLSPDSRNYEPRKRKHAV
jgi:hypothetical protein